MSFISSQLSPSLISGRLRGLKTALAAAGHGGGGGAGLYLAHYVLVAGVHYISDTDLSAHSCIDDKIHVGLDCRCKSRYLEHLLHHRQLSLVVDDFKRCL